MTRLLLSWSLVAIAATAAAACAGTGSVPESASAALQAVQAELAPDIVALNDLAPGMTELGPDHPGREGREYLSTIERVDGLRRPEEALRAYIAASLGGTCGAEGFFCDVRRVALIDEVEAESVFEEADEPLSAPERSAQRVLLRRLSRWEGAYPLYELRAGWTDAVGELHQGLVLVDIARGEILWVRSFDAWAP